MKTTNHIKAVYRYAHGNKLVYDVIYNSGRLKENLRGYELSAAAFRVICHSQKEPQIVNYPFSDNGIARIFFEIGGNIE